MRTLGLKSETEWRDYRKSGRKPNDIPSNPNRTYADLAGLAWVIGSGPAGSPRHDGNSQTPVPLCNHTLCLEGRPFQR